MKVSHGTGPVVWVAIFLITGFLLVVSQYILWLIVPMMMAVAQYYILQPFLRNLVMMGLSFRQAAAAIMGFLFFVMAAGIVFLIPYFSDSTTNWQGSIGRYFDGGIAFTKKTLIGLESQFGFLQRMQFEEKVSHGLDHFTASFVEKYMGEILIEIAKWLPSLLLVPYLTYYMLVDGAN